MYGIITLNMILRYGYFDVRSGADAWDDIRQVFNLNKHSNAAIRRMKTIYFNKKKINTKHSV